MKRIVPVITVTAIILCLAKSIQVKANDITNNYDILALQPGIELTSIIDAYERLTMQQQLIAEYLVGSFNNIYLTARGFRYNIPYDQSNIQAQFSALGSKVFDFITTRIGWKSRVNEVFRQYLSSVIVYASAQNKTFSAWFQGQVSGEDRQIFIPYSEDAFDAWTTFYNDPSGDGIATFGNTVSPWNSGNMYDFAFVGMSWQSSSSANSYNNFILNQSPVCYTNEYIINNNSNPYAYPQTCQIVFPIYNNGKYINSIYILNNTYYSQYRFGYDDGSLPTSSTKTHGWIHYYGSQGLDYGTTFFKLRNGIQSKSNGTLQELINHAFDNTPFQLTLSSGVYFQQSPIRYYPYIEHIYLVDDITTLSNKQEIFNIDDLHIIAPINDGYILAPNDRMILPSFPGVPDDPLGFWDIIVDNSLDVNGDTVSDDDYHTSIVNNNVINNYYVSDDVKINVPVDWFENPYTDQMYEDSNNFIDFAKDCIDCLGDFDIYMYGAIVVGLAGGIVKKLLL